MPIYEYACAKCGETLEIIQKMSDPPPAAHPGCGGALSKVMSVPSFQVRGGGKQNLDAEWSKDPSTAQSTENAIKRKEKKKKPPRVYSKS